MSAGKGSVRRLAGRAGLAVGYVERTFCQQVFKLCPGLVNEGGGKSAGRLLPFSGQILYSHVEQRDVLFKPAQGFFHAGNSEISRKHRGTHLSLPRLPCFRRNASLKLNTCGTLFATTVSETRYCGSDGWVEEKRACRKRRTEVYRVLSGLGMVILSIQENCSPAARPATSPALVARLGKRSESEVRRA